MSRIASFTLGLAIARLALASPVADAHPALITPGPALHRRDYAPDFVGYALWDNGRTDTYTCGSSYTYTYSSGYAGCCSESASCTLATYCDGYTLMYDGGSSYVCPAYCVTQSVFYSTDDSYPAYIVQCDETSYDLTILRTSSLDAGPVTIIVTVTPTAPRPIPTTEPIIQTSSSSSSSSTTTTTPAVPTAPLPAQTSSAPKKSIAPIVGGAVGGAVVLIALVGLGLFFFFKKRSQNSRTPAPGGFGNQPNQPNMASPPPSNYNPYSPNPNVAQGYPSPVSSPAMSAVSPYQALSPTLAPYSPPPMYASDKKSASVTMHAMPTPHSEYEYRLPENTAEVHGISAAPASSSPPPPPNQAPRNGATELA